MLTPPEHLFQVLLPLVLPPLVLPPQVLPQVSTPSRVPHLLPPPSIRSHPLAAPWKVPPPLLSLQVQNPAELDLLLGKARAVDITRDTLEPVPPVSQRRRRPAWDMFSST